MKIRTFLTALLLIFVCSHTIYAQGFRVYNSDGTVLQFSLRTDSIVFYDGIGSEQDLGFFTPVNQMIAGTWYRSKSESITFYENGTTDFKPKNEPAMVGVPYEFFPFQGHLVIYSSNRETGTLLHVAKLTKDSLTIIGEADKWNGVPFCVYTRTQPKQLVMSIELSETRITLQPDQTKRLTATVFPEDADNPAVTWESTNDAVAEVNSSGRVTANSNGTCMITCSATDGSGVYAECKVRVKAPDTMEYVDLALPSGTLWATCNVGASSPEEYGDYFAWGETEPKSNYSWGTYFDSDADGNTFKEYNDNGGLIELEPTDDAATANWGSGWQMPSLAQIQELTNSSYTTTTWKTQNGVNGREITSRSNGNSIFLPAAGYRYDTSLNYAGSYGHYWSRSLNTGSSRRGSGFYFNSSSISTSSDSRYYGQSVRPVRVQ